MANPRKFSEKIALHNQKQAEETAAFQAIMREVMDATVRPPGAPLTPTSTTPQPITPTNQNPSQQQQQQQQQQNHNHLSISLSNYRGHGGSLPNVNQISQHGEKGSHASRGMPSMSPRSPRNSIGPVRSKHRNDHSPYASPPSATMLSSSMTSATSGGFSSYGLGYGNGPTYLTPPENVCRRAISESALHNLLIPSTVPDSSEESSNNSNDPRDYNVAGLGRSPHHDPFSSNSMRDGASHLELPAASMSMSSTGSLPDLTTFHFPPPLQQPLDIDEQSQQNHSPYSTSPLTGSSMTYSPTSMSPHCSPQGAGGGNGNQSQQQSQVQNSQSPHSPQSQHQAPLHVNTSFQNFSNDNMLSAYRNPQRPSPQNSPSPHFRSASPVEGNLSAPASPSPGQTNPGPGSTNEFYLNQQAQVLQQHFEQISMGDRLQNGIQNRTMQMNRQWNEGANAGGQYFYNQQGQIPNTGATAGVTTQQSPQPQTPQTPSSIPDIIFTDFSDVRGTEPLDDLLASEQLQAAFRDGLGPIDFQILDQDFVQLDQQGDDSFRLDRQMDESFRLDRL